MELIFLLFNLIFVICILLFLINFIYGAFRYVPYVPSKKVAIIKMLQVASIKPGEVVYDLGCGDGRLVIKADKEFKAKAIGYEASASIYLLARIRKILSQSKATISSQNFFKANMSDADVVFCYLFPHVMNKLKTKFESELKPGTRVISNSFKISDWKEVSCTPTYSHKPKNALIREYIIGVSNTGTQKKNTERVHQKSKSSSIHSPVVS